jgi:hypothetical protein
MTLTLRRVHYPMATDNYRVVYDGVEVGSIGVQQGIGATESWRWGIDTILPKAPSGKAKDRDDAMAQFRAAWDEFSADADRLAYFMGMKRDNDGRR